MSAPERIWLLWADGTVQDRYHASAKDHTEEGGYPEFIRADLHEAAVAAARAEGMLEAARIADNWLATFGTVEIVHTPAREHASDAVADIRDAIRAEASK